MAVNYTGRSCSSLRVGVREGDTRCKQFLETHGLVRPNRKPLHISSGSAGKGVGLTALLAAGFSFSLGIVAFIYFH